MRLTLTLALPCAALVAGFLACGSRTGLDAGRRATSDASICSTCDGGIDAPDEAAPDAPDDVADEPEIGVDAPPPPSICPDAGSTLVYLASESRELYSYYPPTSSFRDIGPITCPTNQQAFSMAVDRGGTAYVLLSDLGSPALGTLWRVNTADAGCAAIPQYVPGQDGFEVYGMGFASDGDGGDAGETLYLGGAVDYGSTAGLARLDTQTFRLTAIGAAVPSPSGMELTGTGDGRLFGLLYYATPTAFDIAQLDPTSGAVLSQTPVTAPNIGGGFAMAFWGGDFYLFTAPAGDTVVTRYRPGDGSFTAVGSLPGVAIVGAGVSTCAPM